jgi:nitrogen regulatory protein PII
MKEIKAYIKKHKLQDVTSALRRVRGLTGMTVVESRGYGTGWGGRDEGSRGVFLDYTSGIKLEVVCRDELLEEVVSAIEKAAHTGLKGDGKIFVSDIRAAVRISTGERGDAAV